jgi:hypothetical protein
MLLFAVVSTFSFAFVFARQVINAINAQYIIDVYARSVVYSEYYGGLLLQYVQRPFIKISTNSNKPDDNSAQLNVEFKCLKRAITEENKMDIKHFPSSVQIFSVTLITVMNTCQNVTDEFLDYCSEYNTKDNDELRLLNGTVTIKEIAELLNVKHKLRSWTFVGTGVGNQTVILKKIANSDMRIHDLCSQFLSK